MEKDHEKPSILYEKIQIQEWEILKLSGDSAGIFEVLLATE